MENNLNSKIDFAAVITVEDANPNGDPLNGNRPRQHYDNTGFITPVCIKRKIRNRLQDMGKEILIQQNDRSTDGFNNIKDRLKSVPEIKESLTNNNDDEIIKLSCEKYEDVRAFGATLALSKTKGKGKSDSNDKGISIGIRGPVTVQQAKSVGSVDIESNQITKSTTIASDSNKSDTMGMMHSVRFGVYVIKGSINPVIAQRTGFSDADAEDIKEAVRTLFENDESSARPAGSMSVYKLFWAKQPADDIKYSTKDILDSVIVKAKDPDEIPESIDDFDIFVNKDQLDSDVNIEVVDGF